MKKEREELKRMEKVCGQMRRMQPDAEAKTQAMEEIEGWIRRKRIRHTPSWGELALIELQYISPGFWVMQASVVMILLIWLGRTAALHGALKDYLQWISVMAAWMGVIACGDLGRHFSRGMAELEQSCYLNLPQMWTIRMILSGTADILVLLLCGLRISENTSVPFVQVCLYILVPFVLSNGCCLLYVTVFRSARGRYGQLVLFLLTGSVVCVLVMTPSRLYTEAYLWLWVTFLAAGTAFFLWQLRRIYGKIRRGETLCWN
ncbi:hypothetical protein [Acetatifactor muris]|uniref:hypothetical protein n=1 Tax=Acetatifactor muris TaxID=879566 RepID=UPI0023F355D2|nr:hypothetical protein [Acetatifactor muris]